MSELKVQNFHGKQVIDSREVAAMVERPHNDLMKSIRSYCEYLGQGDFSQSDFFIPSTYINSQNKEQPCYLLTKKGCAMVANKMPGKKGVLFTAAYVTAFEEMRQALTAPKHPLLPDGVTFSSAVGFMRLARRVMLDMGSTPVQVGMMMKETLESCGFPVPASFNKQLEGQISLFDCPALES